MALGAKKLNFSEIIFCRRYYNHSIRPDERIPNIYWFMQFSPIVAEFATPCILEHHAWFQRGWKVMYCKFGHYWRKLHEPIYIWNPLIKTNRMVIISSTKNDFWKIQFFGAQGHFADPENQERNNFRPRPFGIMTTCVLASGSYE